MTNTLDLVNDIMRMYPKYIEMGRPFEFRILFKGDFESISLRMSNGSMVIGREISFADYGYFIGDLIKVELSNMRDEMFTNIIALS